MHLACLLGRCDSAILHMPLIDFAFLLLSLFMQGKYICLFFYPKDFTFVCPTEIIAFSGNSARKSGWSVALTMVPILWSLNLE